MVVGCGRANGEQSVDEKPGQRGLERPAEGSLCASPEPTGLPPWSRSTASRVKGYVDSATVKLALFGTSKVLRGVPTRLQVGMARQSKFVEFSNDQDIIFQAGAKCDADYFLVLAEGRAEILVPGETGQVVVGTVGPGAVLGGLRVTGLVTRHLMTVRRAVDSDADPLRQQAVDSDVRRAADLMRCPRLAGYMLSASEMQDLTRSFEEEVDILRLRLLNGLRALVLHHLARVAASGFFRRYNQDFLNSLSQEMDLRICTPSELIFEQNQEAHSLVMLFCGQLEVWVGGRKVMSRSQPGTCFGEAALLDENALRGATVRGGESEECLVCLISKKVFMATVDRFPEDKARLNAHVRQNITALCLRDTFRGCDSCFTDFLATLCDSVILQSGMYACREGMGPAEALHICRHGEAFIEKSGQQIEVMRKGDAVGFEPALGISKPTPPDYSIVGGAAGCLLIRMSYDMLEKALLCFPDELIKLLRVVDSREVPVAHPFSGRENEVWESVQKLLSASFMSSDPIGIDLCQRLRPFMKIAVYDAGLTIVKEGEDGHMSMLLNGSVIRDREAGAHSELHAPVALDDAIGLGMQTKCRATVRAKTPCVVWYFPALETFKDSTKVDAESKKSLLKIVEEGARIRNSLLHNIQAKLRNMKVFRKLKSEILEFLSNNMEVRMFLAGETIFAECDKADCMYVLLRGKAVSIWNGKAMELEDGVAFGEEGLIKKGERISTVRAVTDCICHVVYASIVDRAFADCPDLRESAFPTIRSAASQPHPRQTRHGQLEQPLFAISKLKQRMSLKAQKGPSSRISPSSPRTLQTQHSHTGDSVQSGADASTDIQQKTQCADPVHIQQTSSTNPMCGHNGSHSSSCEPLHSMICQMVEQSFCEALVSGKSGPHHLAQRFQIRSCLHDDPVPSLPYALRVLYQAFPSAEDDCASAFSSVIPKTTAIATARMNGVVSRSCSAYREAQELLKKRGRSVGATHTSPLPVVRQMPARLGPVRSKQTACGGVASSLQLYASGLVRITSKTKLGLGQPDTSSAAAEQGQGDIQHVVPAQPASSSSRWQVKRRGKNVRLTKLYADRSVGWPKYPPAQVESTSPCAPPCQSSIAKGKSPDSSANTKEAGQETEAQAPQGFGFISERPESEYVSETFSRRGSMILRSNSADPAAMLGLQALALTAELEKLASGSEFTPGLKHTRLVSGSESEQVQDSASETYIRRKSA